MSDCDHKNRNIKWEKDALVHTCRICHETWIEPRVQFAEHVDGEVNA